MGTESAWGAVSRCTITAEQPALNENTFVKAVSAESGRPFFTDAVKATEITSQASHSAPEQRPVRPATPSDRSPEGSGGIHRTGERQAACFSINAPRSSPRLRSVRTACGSFPAGGVTGFADATPFGIIRMPTENLQQWPENETRGGPSGVLSFIMRRSANRQPEGRRSGITRRPRIYRCSGSRTSPRGAIRPKAIRACSAYRDISESPGRRPTGIRKRPPSSP